MKGKRDSKIYGKSIERIQHEEKYFYFNIDLTAHKLKKTPLFVNTYVSGARSWDAAGADSIFDLSPTGFKVYIGCN